MYLYNRYVLGSMYFLLPILFLIALFHLHFPFIPRQREREQKLREATEKRLQMLSAGEAGGYLGASEQRELTRLREGIKKAKSEMDELVRREDMGTRIGLILNDVLSSRSLICGDHGGLGAATGLCQCW